MKDEKYTDLILNGDIHTYNQKLAGLPTRNDAKLFIYALLYGAGDEKLGSIVGKGSKAGAQLRKRFLNGLPAYAKLLGKVQDMAARDGVLPALDGRKIHVRSQHSALNSLLQSAGAVVMKYALVIACNKLDDIGLPYKLVAQVHDEMQLEVPECYADRVGVIVRNAIKYAGRELNMRCPLAGEAKIGDNWSCTH
jgi:DNA polymerase I-like protein with 3'-5' exonuclease and polymerase domains